MWYSDLMDKLKKILVRLLVLLWHAIVIILKGIKQFDDYLSKYKAFRIFSYIVWGFLGISAFFITLNYFTDVQHVYTNKEGVKYYCRIYGYTDYHPDGYIFSQIAKVPKEYSVLHLKSMLEVAEKGKDPEKFYAIIDGIDIDYDKKLFRVYPLGLYDKEDDCLVCDDFNFQKDKGEWKPFDKSSPYYPIIEFVKGHDPKHLPFWRRI